MEIIKLSLPACDKVSEVGYLKQYSVNETFQIHTHDFYEFFYVCKGRAIHEINDTTQVLEQGALVFIRPSDVHKFEFFNHYDMHSISCGVEPWMIERAMDYLGIEEAMFTESLLPPMVILEGKDFTNMEKCLDSIGRKKPGPERKTYFLSILPELLYLFLNSGHEEHKGLPGWLAELLGAMNEPANFIAGLDRMLELSSVSQEHLTREFRRWLQVTPTEYINFKRINYAAELLLQDSYEIIDVCYMSGYNNLTYFYKMFRKQYNCTPKEFLKRHG